MTPARTVSPGRVLQRELDARGWSSLELALFSNLSERAIALSQNSRMTPGIAKELSLALGTTAEFWLNLEANYRKVTPVPPKPQ